MARATKGVSPDRVTVAAKKLNVEQVEEREEGR